MQTHTNHPMHYTTEGLWGSVLGMLTFNVAWLWGYFSDLAGDALRAAVLAFVSAIVGSVTSVLFAWAKNKIAKAFK